MVQIGLWIDAIIADPNNTGLQAETAEAVKALCAQFPCSRPGSSDVTWHRHQGKKKGTLISVPFCICRQMLLQRLHNRPGEVDELGRKRSHEADGYHQDHTGDLNHGVDQDIGPLTGLTGIGCLDHGEIVVDGNGGIDCRKTDRHQMIGPQGRGQGS